MWEREQISCVGLRRSSSIMARTEFVKQGSGGDRVSAAWPRGIGQRTATQGSLLKMPNWALGVGARVGEHQRNAMAIEVGSCVCQDS